MSKEIPIPKEAVLHAQNDLRNLREGRSTEQIMIGHARPDMAALPPESPGITERPPGVIVGLAERAGNAWENLYIGGEHAKSMFKLGAHELTQALAAFPDSNIRPLEEPGVFLNEHMPHIQEFDNDYIASREQNDDRSRSR